MYLPGGLMGVSSKPHGINWQVGGNNHSFENVVLTAQTWDFSLAIGRISRAYYDRCQTSEDSSLPLQVIRFSPVDIYLYVHNHVTFLWKSLCAPTWKKNIQFQARGQNIFRGDGDSGLDSWFGQKGKCVCPPPPYGLRSQKTSLRLLIVTVRASSPVDLWVHSWNLHAWGAFHQAFCQCFSLTNLLSANQMQGFQ